MNARTTTTPAINVERLINQLRRERNLPTIITANPRRLTRKDFRLIAIEVWKKYPQSLNDPNYELGELTLSLVEKEIRQRIADQRRGIVVGQAALKDYFN